MKLSAAEIDSLLFAEQGSNPATPASGFGRLFVKSDGLYFIDDAGAVTGPFGGSAGGGGGALAVVSYNPDPAVTPATTGTSLTDIDATNLKIDFTVPASGAVIVRLTAHGYTAASNSQLHWGLREGSSDVTGSDQQITNASSPSAIRTYTGYFSGLTAEAAKTWKWAHRRGGANNANTWYGAGVGPAIMEVWAA